jgi:alpha-galactosidase/6-phospho-beta-glucosidase family protein
LPPLAPIIAQHNANQELIIEAALLHNKELAFQAIFNEPPLLLPIDIAWKMLDRLLCLDCDYLPG